MLDPGRLGGYLHRLAMLGLGRHNWSERPSTMWIMDASAMTNRAAAERRIDAGDPQFPTRLRDLPIPPAGLWVRGALPAAGARVVAIVGSRAATKAGAARVTSLAAELAQAGWRIISGGALGIDAAAHQGALDAETPTFAVLGCGIDQIYPDRHAGLFRRIAARGGLLSEYGPGTPPRHGQFPARNRLVAAMAEAIIVGECGIGSGALITARIGVQLGRPLLAVPGSPGANGIIAAGDAIPIGTAAEALAALAGKHGTMTMTRPVPPAGSPLVEALQALGVGPATPEAVAAKLGSTLAEALGLLAEAELEGLVTRVPGGRFEVLVGN